MRQQLITKTGHQPVQDHADGFIFLHTSHGSLKSVSVEHILYVQASNSYSVFVIRQPRVKLSRIAECRTLDHCQQKLEKYGFIRVNRSLMVNIRHIREYFQKAHYIEMNDGSEFAVSREQRAVVHARLDII